MAQSFDPRPGQDVQEKAQQAARRETAPPRERRLRGALFQAYLAAALVVFLLLAVLARSAAYFELDVSITRWMQQFSLPWFDALMRAVSWPGYMPQAAFLVLLAVGLVYWFGYHWEALMLAGCVVGVQLLNVAVKLAVRRPRPPSTLVEVYQILSSYSFPSGHVMAYLALYGFLLFLVFTILRQSAWRVVLGVGFVLMILLVGPSRIYLGEHWASDVLAAYLLGSLGLALAVAGYRAGKKRTFPRQPVAKE